MLNSRREQEIGMTGEASSRLTLESRQAWKTQAAQSGEPFEK
jgi:hypothetical protein